MCFMVLSFQALKNAGKLNCCRHSNNARKRAEKGHFGRILTADYLINFPSSRHVMSFIWLS
jgi:hypothetical protein